MKLTIRFADQIVGGLIIVALGTLVFAVFMLGSNQRWFSRDYRFKTYFSSAAGLSRNMAVQYKGFTIGKVVRFDLSEDDNVEVHFTIFDTYVDRVREGSMVEVLVSPIGMGNQFMFYPGMGENLVNEDETIPAVTSAEARKMIAAGIALRPERDDSINNIMNQASSALGSLNDILLEVQEALVGNDRTDLGRTVRNIQATTASLPNVTKEAADTLQTLRLKIDPVLSDVDILLRDLGAFSAALTDPDGTIMSVLDSKNLSNDITSALDSIAGILGNLEKTSDFIPTQLPQVAALLSDLHGTLRVAQDVLIAASNNPLLKRGIPEYKETKTGGARPRDLEF